MMLHLDVTRRPSAVEPAPDPARAVYELVARVAGSPPFRLTMWDGSAAGPADAATVVHLARPRALRRLIWQPNELGLARAFVTGDLTVSGDLVGALRAGGGPNAAAGTRFAVGQWPRAMRLARRLHAIGPPVSPPAGEVRLHGALHSRRRDAAAVSHHYDVGNDFYRLLLDESMTYSCAYWTADPSSSYSLADAQADKYALIEKKLGLRAGMRMLDVGCGWGGMLIHAATHHDITGVGITLSHEQAKLARERVAAAGLADRLEIRLCDYREIDGTFDAISSIGMAEHVGASAFAAYAGSLHSLLASGGRLLNHQISKPAHNGPASHSAFIERYIFPDGELLPIASVLSALEVAGFEVRDVESLRENYTLTLLEWLKNLRTHRDEMVRLVGAERTRTWELYIAGSAAAFDTGRIGIHQTLATKTVDGRSGLPRVRRQWLCG
jgi:cyclopropane-fatty-acyl-phospholipid synthase